MEGRYSLNEFVKSTEQKEQGQGVFELEGSRFLELHLNSRVWIKVGAMVAYRGNVTFGRESALEGGLGKFAMRFISGETQTFAYAEGNGLVYCADQGKKISIISLNNESLYVQGNDVLAFESSIKYDIKIVKKVAGMLGGGLFCVLLQGTGMVAITTHHEPLTLVASASSPVYTDPNATVAWSGSLYPEIKIDTTFQTLLRGGSGETVQYVFRGDGFVVVQPYEEVYHVTA